MFIRPQIAVIRIARYSTARGAPTPTYLGQCDLCSEVFATDMILLRHVNEKHLGVTCEYTAEAAQWVFPPGLMYKCRLCSTKTYASCGALMAHYEQKHPRDVPTRKAQVLTIEAHKCMDCNKLFASASLLTEHRFAIHNAMSHEKAHAKPYRCEECPGMGRDFPDPVTCMAHVLTTHGEEKPTTSKKANTGLFDCFFCSKHYKTLSALAGHIAQSHPREDILNNDENFNKCFGAEGFEMCDCVKGCGRRFITREYQRMHAQKGCGTEEKK